MKISSSDFSAENEQTLPKISMNTINKLKNELKETDCRDEKSKGRKRKIAKIDEITYSRS